MEVEGVPPLAPGLCPSTPLPVERSRDDARLAVRRGLPVRPAYSSKHE